MWTDNGINILSLTVNLLLLFTNFFIEAFPLSSTLTLSRCYNNDKDISLYLSESKSSSWACTATPLTKNDKDRVKVSQVDNLIVDGFDINSPREWMEFLENKEGRGGAYTVLRCDIGNFDKRPSQGIETRLWGMDFHLDRIVNSYSKMVAMEGGLRENFNSISTETSNNAIQMTHCLLDALINDAVNKVQANGEPMDEGHCKVIMLTVLWTQAKSPKSLLHQQCPDILVRGHSFCNNISIIPEDYNPKPISATAALPNVEMSESLVGRYDLIPEAKLSYWCQRRKALESRFKEGNGEVILMQESCSSNNTMAKRF